VFSIHNILEKDTAPDSAKWDVIVSNPPYVLMEEAALMERNVIDFEPHLALFVPDHEPLIFYRAIAQFASRHLNHLGSLYFEINEKQGAQVAALLREFGFQEISIRKDLQGKERMAKGKK